MKTSPIMIAALLFGSLCMACSDDDDDGQKVNISGLTSQFCGKYISCGGKLGHNSTSATAEEVQKAVDNCSTKMGAAINKSTGCETEASNYLQCLTSDLTTSCNETVYQSITNNLLTENCVESYRTYATCLNKGAATELDANGNPKNPGAAASYYLDAYCSTFQSCLNQDSTFQCVALILGENNAETYLNGGTINMADECIMKLYKYTKCASTKTCNDIIAADGWVCTSERDDFEACFYK